MVQEVRRIMLTPDELLAAFESHRRATPDFLPEGMIIDCVPMEDNRVRLTLKTPSGRQPKTDFVFRSNDAVKPLIRFCLENKIMLPREGQKSLYVKDGVASLYVVLNLPVDVSDRLPPPEFRRSHTILPADIAREAVAAES